MTIGIYPGAALAGMTIMDVVNSCNNQVSASLALAHRFNTQFVLSAMDLSVEAGAFGSRIQMTQHEVPAVVDRIVTSLSDAQRLVVPKLGAGRTAMFTNVVSRLHAVYPNKFVLAGCIGPFSLAARLAGTSEALELTLKEPELMHTLLEKSTEFLTQYVLGFRNAGASGIIMAEPTAGLMSPKGLAEFSSAYVRRIAEAIGDDRFAIILHNCTAKLVHLPAILETGLSSFHFGAPMDIVTALSEVPTDVVLCGNLDPSGVFVQSTVDGVRDRTNELLAATRGKKNFVPSSGCDLPGKTPLNNLRAFFDTVSGTI